jgi:hypothetical protein
MKNSTKRFLFLPSLIALSIAGCVPSIPAKQVHIDSITYQILSDERMNAEDIKKKLSIFKENFASHPSYTSTFEEFLDHLRAEAKNAFADEIEAKTAQLADEFKVVTAHRDTLIPRFKEYQAMLRSVPVLEQTYAARLPSGGWNGKDETIATLRELALLWSGMNKEKITDVTTPILLSDDYSLGTFNSDLADLVKVYQSWSTVKDQLDRFLKARENAANRVIQPVDEWVAKQSGQ